MQDYTDKRVVITGASSGIGKALALEFLQRGARVIALASRESSLERLADMKSRYRDQCRLLAYDLRDLDHLDSLADNCLQFWDGIDIFIANAGLSQRALVVDTEIQVMKELLAVNYTSQIILTRRFLPGMIERNFGIIAPVSSIAGVFGTPLRSSYGGAKSAQTIFYEALSHEVYKNNIYVPLIIVGFVRTNISINARVGDGSTYGKMDSIQDGAISPEKAAVLILKGINKKKHRIYAGLVAKSRLALFLKRFAPSLLFRILKKAKVV